VHVLVPFIASSLPIAVHRRPAIRRPLFREQTVRDVDLKEFACRRADTVRFRQQGKSNASRALGSRAVPFWGVVGSWKWDIESGFSEKPTIWLACRAPSGRPEGI
jgi:hypothetical protein